MLLNQPVQLKNSGKVTIFKRKIKTLLEKVTFYFGEGDSHRKYYSCSKQFY